jgi:hypothetical protein|tara:strand:- start:1115 stop:4357 length:3243 start_codon:yes stop_codon:yes gene_type:complete
MFNERRFSKSLVATSLLLALAGCNDDEVPNVAPTASAGADFSVNELTSAVLSGTGEDSDGSIETYSWVQTAGTEVTIENANSAQAQFLAPNVKPSETLTFELTVTDNDGETATDSVDVEVVHINAPPELDTADQTAAEKSDVVITAVAQDDSMVVGYAWEQTGGELVTLSGKDSATLSFTAPSVTQDTTLTFLLIVEDDEGATAEQNVSVVITPELVTFTVEGLVTDSPIANANIVVKVGSETFDVTAESDGRYTFDVSVDDDSTQQMISMIATGVDSQSHAKLASILGSVNALNSLVNEEGVISSDELFSVNVTNVTTATVALMQRENLGEEIDTDEALQGLSLQVSAQEKFELATAIKVAIDFANGDPNLSLPDGISDTLALAQNTEAAEAYVESISETDAFETAYDEIVSDPDLIDTNDVSLAQPFFITDFNNPLLSNPGKFVDLQANGIATYQNFLDEYVGEWELTDNRLSVSFPDGAYTYASSETVEIDGNMQTVETEVSILEIAYIQLENSNGVLTLEATETYSKRYPNGELPDTGELVEPPVQLTALTLESISSVGLPSGADAGIALPITQSLFESNNELVTSYSLSADTFIFNVDGTGTTVVSELGFQWEQIPWGGNNAVNVLRVTFDGGVVLDYLQVTQQASVNLYAVWGISSDESTSSFKLDSGDVIEQNEAFDVTTVPGIYTYSFDGETINEFWWELWEDGKAYSIESVDRDGNGALSSEEVTVMYGDWTVTDDGALVINRYPSLTSGWPGCFELDEDCYHYNKRSWTLFAQNEDAFHITNRHQFDFNGADGSNGPDGLFEYDVMDNRRISKSGSRPVTVALPHLDTLPDLPPQSFKSLLSPEVYYDTPLYGVEQNAIFELETAQLSMQLSSDGTFTFSGEKAGGDVTGTFEVRNDNGVLLTVGEGSALQVFLTESSDVVVAANEGYPVPFFSSPELAAAHEQALRDAVSTGPMNVLNDLPLAMVEISSRDYWVIRYVMFNGSEATIYEDETFTTVRQTYGYTTNEDGSISFDDRLYLSLTTDEFWMVASEQTSENYIDFNYMFTDIEKAKTFARNANALLSKSKMMRQ